MKLPQVRAGRRARPDCTIWGDTQSSENEDGVMDPSWSSPVPDILGGGNSWAVPYSMLGASPLHWGDPHRQDPHDEVLPFSDFNQGARL